MVIPRPTGPMNCKAKILTDPKSFAAYLEAFGACGSGASQETWERRFVDRVPAWLLALDTKAVRGVVTGFKRLKDDLNLEASEAFAPFLDAILETQLKRGDTPFEVPLSFLERRDDPARALALAEIAMNSVGLSGGGAEDRPPWSWDGRRRLRVGYVCSNLRMHPVGFSVRSMLGYHDRDRFEIHVYDRTDVPARTVEGPVRLMAERFHEVRDLAPKDVATRIAADAIDVLIDLSGAPLAPKQDVFRYRPAPVQIAMIGYPGATGAGTVDYTVVDPVVVPATERAGFSERLIFMPDGFLPVDNSVEEEPIPSRSDLGLPADAFVMAAFNRFSKINLLTLKLWFACLKRVPDAVLWTAPETREAGANLRRLALQAGLDSDRLIFAAPTGIREHRARLAAADIALDPLGYSGGYTTVLALQRGVPVVTMPGRSFAWRMSASILQAAGLTEGIAERPADYLARVERFARDAHLLSACRNRLCQDRGSGLFPTRPYVEALEQAFRTIARNRSAGRPDEDFSPVA